MRFAVKILALWLLGNYLLTLPQLGKSSRNGHADTERFFCGRFPVGRTWRLRFCLMRPEHLFVIGRDVVLNALSLALTFSSIHILHHQVEKKCKGGVYLKRICGAHSLIYPLIYMEIADQQWHCSVHCFNIDR